MKAIDIHNHMREIGSWVDWETTCDGFKSGLPEAEVRAIAVGWQSTFPALRQAHEDGCNLFITHEPTFYTHMDDDPDVFCYEHVREKKAFLEETGMVIYRCHDVWDRMPDIGISDSWARGLGFEGEPAARDTFHVAYDIQCTVREIAERIREKTSAIGQERVEVIGDLDKPVSRIAMGTGAITQLYAMADLGADIVIGTDDGMNLWSAAEWCLDRELPLIIVNHCTSEEWGIINLAKYVAGTFPEIPVKHIPQGCVYRLI